MPDQVLPFRLEPQNGATARIGPDDMSPDPGLLLASITSFRAALMSAPTPYMVFTKEGATVLVNESFVRATGYDLGDLPDIRACLEKMRRVSDQEIESVHAGWLRAQSQASSKEITVWTAWDERLVWRIQTSDPLIWPDGRTVIIQSMFDLTEQKRLEETLRRNQDEMRVRLAELESLYSSAPLGLGMLDRDLKFVRVNDALADMNGVALQKHIGQFVFDIVPDLQGQAEKLLRGVLNSGEPVRDIEFRGETQRAKGEQRDWLEQLYPLRDSMGEIVGIGIICEDITERKSTEQHIRTLLSELAHRSKNLLTVIQVMARRSVSPELSSSEFVDSFIERLSGLAQSHDLLAREDWRGISMQELVTSQIGHLNSDLSSRLFTDGPDLILTPVAAQNLGMAVHELSTNAVKYGALSVDGGEVHISWAVFKDEAGRDRLRLSWVERGGPKVVEPSRRGFGRFVIEAIAARALSGAVDLRFDPEGVSCTLEGAADSTVIAQRSPLAEASLASSGLA